MAKEHEMSVSDNVSSLELLRKEVARILNTEVPSSDVQLAELGVDSLNVVELLLFCDQLYGSVDMERLDIGQFTTLQTLDEQLRRESRPLLEGAVSA
jgi:acyl carrier protein